MNGWIDGKTFETALKHEYELGVARGKSEAFSMVKSKIIEIMTYENTSDELLALMNSLKELEQPSQKGEV